MRNDPASKLSWALISLLLLGSAIFCLSSEKPQDRTRTTIEKPLLESAFRAKLNIENPVEFVPIYILTELRVKVKNLSDITWPAGTGRPDEPYNIYLSYHLYSKGGNFIMDGPKTPLPYDIKPGENAIVYAKVFSHMEGDFRMEFDLIQEGVGWFGPKGSRTSTINMRVITSD
ncbi:MAG: hypothetical protein HY805_04720 [Nitrospirae bacterium]|nr:hypothetical protein [Nitrospirota bacterium]